MSNVPALRIFRGQTVHQRSTPFVHRFRYGLSLIDIDIDRLGQAAKTSALFGVDTPGLFSFRRKDHGARDGGDLRSWAEEIFAKADLNLATDQIRLLTFPRHWFFKFAPISIWISYDADGAPSGIIYEVNNTFGDTHSYAAKIDAAQRSQHSADKSFHVSPFFDISGKYRFTVRLSDDAFKLAVETRHKETGQTHVATIDVTARPANGFSFAKIALAKPFSSLAVPLAIHWQALKLWVKGARYHSRPPPPPRAVTRATASTSTQTEDAAV